MMLRATFRNNFFWKTISVSEYVTAPPSVVRFLVGANIDMKSIGEINMRAVELNFCCVLKISSFSTPFAL
jgi:hypothetical protein